MLKINVGLSRKVTEDYNSKGFSLNIEGELPSDVLRDDKVLAESTNRLFALANLMLDEQVKKATAPAADLRQERSSRYGVSHGAVANGNGRSYGPSARNGDNGHNGNGNRPAKEERLLTQAQHRAISSMCNKLKHNADDWTRNELGVERVEELTVKQASQAIDYLKHDLEAAAKGGAR